MNALRYLSISIVFLIVITGTGLHQKAASQSSPITPSDHIISNPGYVLPTAVVIDYYLYNSTELPSIEYWEEFVLNLYDFINGHYQNSTIPVYFRVDLIMIYTDEANNIADITYTPIGGGEIDTVGLLESFSDFVDVNTTLNGYEEIQLLSGRDFQSTTAGLAWVGDPTRSPKSDSFYPRSIVQATYPIEVVAKLAAHEIAHNYSAGHDGVDNICHGSNFLMSTTISSQSYFSSCSISELTSYFALWFSEYEDSTVPILTDIDDFDIAQEIGGYLLINWTVSDDNPGSYSLEINNNTEILAHDIINNVIQYNLSLDVAGPFHFELNITDLVGHHAQDIFTLEIGGDLTPRITPLTDIVDILENETLTLSWNLIDDGNSSIVTLYQNDDKLVESNETLPLIYNYTVSNLDPGEYLFKIEVVDEIGQIDVSIIEIEVLSLDSLITTDDTVTTTTIVSDTNPPSTVIVTGDTTTDIVIVTTGDSSTTEEAADPFGIDLPVNFSPIVWILLSPALLSILYKTRRIND